MKILSKRDNGIFFQTKAGGNVEEILDTLNGKENIVFYVTITTLNPEISRNIEPNAPLPQQRIEFIKKLKKLNQEVVVAVNPCDIEWMPENDLIKLENEMSAIGINSFIFQPLHLSRIQLEKIRINKLTQTQTEKLKKRTIKEYAKKQLKRQLDKGLLSCYVGSPFYSGMYKMMLRKLGKMFNSHQQFIDWCHVNKKDGDVVTCEEYINVIIGENEDLRTLEHKTISKYIFTSNFHN